MDNESLKDVTWHVAQHTYFLALGFFGTGTACLMYGMYYYAPILRASPRMFFVAAVVACWMLYRTVHSLYYIIGNPPVLRVTREGIVSSTQGCFPWSKIDRIELVTIGGSRLFGIVLHAPASWYRWSLTRWISVTWYAYWCGVHVFLDVVEEVSVDEMIELFVRFRNSAHEPCCTHT